jgi:hypothetical protein
MFYLFSDLLLMCESKGWKVRSDCLLPLLAHLALCFAATADWQGGH